MILRPPRSTRTDNSFPTRLSSDLLRFVYIDPKPDFRSISFGRHGEPVEGEEKRLPGFLTTILGALSEIPREQPIRDNVEAIEAMSRRIRRMQPIVDAEKVEVEEDRKSVVWGKGVTVRGDPGDGRLCKKTK